MKNLQEIEFTIPDHALSYLINGDCSSLEDDEIIEIDEFCEYIANTYGNANFMQKEDLGFCVYNDIDSLGNNCSTCIILTNKEGV